jgi:branched-chain amino acid transport system substrate-binding protein
MLIFSVLSPSFLLADSVHLYLDADFSVLNDSAIAIQRGMESRLEYEKKNGLDLNIKIIPLDHRGNTRRSLVNFKKVAADEKAIAVFGGLHSPPLISNNDFINNKRILTLVPWAAGGPITRSKVKENWIYRLSVDDQQAGGFLANAAIKKNQCKKPYLVLEETPWGKSNERNMRKAFTSNAIAIHQISFFSWGISKALSSDVAAKVKESQADCMFFVGSTNDGLTIFSALARAKVDLPIYSHWGILATEVDKIGALVEANQLNLRVIQTNFSFLDGNLNKYQKDVLQFILKKYNLKGPEEMSPMTGYVHGFDLMGLFLAAYKDVDKNMSIQRQRFEIKKKLENLKMVKGLIKNYKKPFSEYNKKNPNAHEALSDKDYDLRRISKEGYLLK